MDSEPDEGKLIKEKLANFWQKIKLVHPVIWIGVFAVLIFGSTCYYSIKYPYINPPKRKLEKIRPNTAAQAHLLLREI